MNESDHTEDADRDEGAAIPRGPAAPDAEDAPAALITHPAFLPRLRGTVDEAYASMVANQREAVAVIEAAIVRLSRPDVDLTPALKSELIAKYGALLARLEQLQSLLPRGREGALKSLDGVALLQQQLDEERAND